MSSTKARVIVQAPRGYDATALAVAASRAGALGVLRGRVEEAAALLAAARRVAGFTDRPFGARIEGAAEGLAWLREVPEGLAVVILDADAAEGDIEQVRRVGRTVLVEVRTREEAAAAERAGADGVIVAGQEAGGEVGSESSFVLLQAVLATVAVPVWVRGGVGLRTASACVAAGAAGVVLDGAVALARESPLPEPIRRVLRRWDGSEPQEFRPIGGRLLRAFAPTGSAALTQLRDTAGRGGDAWRETLAARVGWGPDQAWPVGQDAAFAGPLAEQFQTVGGIVQAVERAIDEGVSAARRARPLAEGSPLARSLATRFPILQGPMTRVSDVPTFAERVAGGGALPFLALALLRGDDLDALLTETARRLAGRSWGVGLLGFTDPGLRAEQVERVKAARPPFALIAGGRPDQAAELEREGIGTFLHVPSPALLEQFLKAGARRVVLEGRECGGHVGPRSGFVLWEQAAGVIERAIGAGLAPGDLQVVFAGGIHDARSAAAVAALAGPLAAKGCQVGVLIGTAYLFTREAVEAGAIVPRYQDEALRCRETVLLETGPGHVVRACASPFAEQFEAERRRMLAEGWGPEAVRDALERLNVGRLRVAAKGIDREDGAGSPLVGLDEAEQGRRGLYMIGQVAALRDQVTMIEDLHRDVSEGSAAHLDRQAAPVVIGPEPATPSDVAIVGMSAVFPGAADLPTFWANTLRGLDAIIEVPPDRWDWRAYYDPDPNAPDRIISKWGGFVPEIPFDPLPLGMPPRSLDSIEPAQLLALEVARRALADSGYDRRPFPRERTAVVLGMGGGAAQLAMGYAFRSYLPMLDGVRPGSGRATLEACAGLLPEWTEDSFPGFLLNVTAGRIANRLDLGGANYTVDAACGSSLAAAALAVRELETGAADVVILGGIDTVQNPFTYLAFSKTHAFSPRGRCRPFDAGADGIVISEGAAAVVLKRLADAQRDGDRIYAVIKGVGSSSDGRQRGLTAPGLEGQLRALRRAYAKAGVSPSSVGYIEAHGTGTALGDVVEVEALRTVFEESGAGRAACGLGSIKSLIGHTKCAAGLAGLINAALALSNRVLPPTIGVERPNPKARLDGGPFWVNVGPRPWFHAPHDRPRRAGVSAFGFGGTNFHVVLEAYEGDPAATPPAPLPDWEAELFLWRSPEPGPLASTLDRLIAALERGARPRLRDLAASLAAGWGPNGATLAIVATSHEDLLKKLRDARRAVAEGRERVDDPAGMAYEARPRFAGAKLAFVFPGQGAQAVGMLGDLAFRFDEVRRGFEAFDATLDGGGRPPISPLVFPPGWLDDDGRARADAALRSTEVAQPAVGAASAGVLALLRSLALVPDLLAGHSFGELVALHAAGALGVEDLAILAESRGRLMRAAAGDDPGAMAAVAGGAEVVDELIAGLDDIEAVNWNGPQQTVVAGGDGAIAALIERAGARGIAARRLAVACAFHTRRVAGASSPFVEQAASRLSAPRRPVVSNLDAAPHPDDPAAIARRLGDHLASPVRFAGTIEALHDAGARVFVEVGPGLSLTRLVGSILGDRPHLAVGLDAKGQPGLPTLLKGLARLAAAGVDFDPSRLFAGRAAADLDLDRLPPGDGSAPPSPSTWLVNGSRARPLDAPEPRRLGQAPELLGTPAPAPEAGRRPEPTREATAVYRNGNGHPHAPEEVPFINSLSRSDRGKAPAAPADVARVLAEHQETMRRFLDVQKSTMLAYLAAVERRPASGGNGIAHHGEARAEPPPPVTNCIRTALPATGGQRRIEVPAKPTEPAPTPATEGPATRLLELVRERTGYPAEMLKLDLDLEADLGIDSIKRVEILGKLRDEFPTLDALSDSRAMDALSRARTLGAIVERIAPAIGKAPQAIDGQPAREPLASREPAVPRAEVRRLVLEAVEAPLANGSGGLTPGGAVLITDDGRGMARGLATRLEAQGHRVVVAGAPGDAIPVDWTSAASVEALLGRVRREANLCAVAHLLPLRRGKPPGLDAEGWSGRLGAEVKGLFLLARAAAADLERAAALGGSALVAATAMGGAFASGGRSLAEFFPGQGGVAGLLKTLAREWPEVRVRVVDLNFDDPSDALADRMSAEILTDDGWAEVGYWRGRRVRLRTTPAPIVEAGSPPIDPGDPVLITGGARGITAAVAAGLARAWRPTLLLIGTSPPPAAVEDAATAELESAVELKAAILDARKRAGEAIGPADVDRQYRTLLRAREIRRNLETLREAGAVVEYASCDVRDADALGRTLERWRTQFGDPRGLIHGAGLIQDKLLRDKTPEAFDRVLGTKIDGALNLARLLRPEPLRFAALFSSVAGRFGNPGQTDYAAANEILNKLAVWLDRRWPGRVVSILWGPWSGVGMVSDLEDHLHRRGLGMIVPRVGQARFLDELNGGSRGQVEVILSAALGDMERPIHRGRPLLQSGVDR